MSNGSLNAERVVYPPSNKVTTMPENAIANDGNIQITDPDQDSLLAFPRLQILTLHSKTHMGLTFDAPARAPSVARGNENPDVGLECKTFPPNSGNILQKLREFLKYEIHVSRS
ncbi:hypothetical protein TNCV_987911 [Trichonephila clavipes]|nr:hypothetical protein TNCV_987911 [Trichonephila clavipes]